MITDRREGWSGSVCRVLLFINAPMPFNKRPENVMREVRGMYKMETVHVHILYLAATVVYFFEIYVC